jgi:YfiH family protein
MTAPLLLTSPRLVAIGVPHAFTTRQGGVSKGMFDSLNFGNPGDLLPHERDTPETIARNIAAVLDSIHAPSREVVQVYQVHAADVHVVLRGQPTHRGETTRADALVTDDATRIAAVRVADCTPVLIASGDGRIVAAVHAGWRGVIADVVTQALLEMERLGAKSCVAAIGPCICEEEFEIGPEVVAQFRDRFGASTRHARDTADGKGRANLQGALREQLEAAGVTAIDVLAHCTVRESARFFSHRRDQGRTGRMMALIGPRSE